VSLSVRLFSDVDWEVRRGVHDEIVSGRGGGDPPPPLFRVGLFPLPKRMGVQEGILPFSEGGFPAQKKVSENEDSSSIACPHNLFCWPPTSRIETTIATTTLVHRK